MGSIVKRNDGVDYVRDFLKLIGLKNVRMSEVRYTEEALFYIRHDVDHDLNTAIAIAEVEAELGYVSTFFLLPPGTYEEERNYYGWIENGKVVHDPSLIDRCCHLIDLGHDIGFHNDLVSMALKTRKNPDDILAREVEFFEKHHVRLVGTASHGSPLARQLKYNNREVFLGCTRKGWEPGRTIRYNDWEVKLHSLRLSDFGFEFEAYSLPRDSRISDSGGKWGGIIVGQRIDKERLHGKFELHEFRAIISRLNPEAKVKAMQVMTHPCHWRVV